MIRMSKVITPSKPHFFQPIIRGSSLHIWIPNAFQTKYLVVNGEKCSEGEAILRSNVYVGKSWTVKLKESKFQDGQWEDFFRAHNLHVGDFVVFRYEGDMVFHVLVFDGSTCEIDYPPLDVIKMEEEKSHKRGRDEHEQAIINGNYKNAKEAVEGWERACSLRFKHPHFVATMMNYNLDKKSYMNIPVGFARSNIPRSKHSVVFKDEKGRVWPVKLRRRGDSDRVMFGRGWLEFSVANGLKEGDVCVFELINLSKNVDMMEFKVSALV